MNIYLFSFALFLGTLLQTVYAQKLHNIPSDLKFQHFTSVNGLSQRSVADIVQDKKGYIWFGTRDGLNKFDGQKFIIYRHTLVDSNSLSNSNVHAIYEDSYGHLWVGTERGLNKYNPTTDNFIRYQLSDAPGVVSDNVVRGITQIDND